MSAFASPAGTDAFPFVGSALLGDTATLGGPGGPRRISVAQPAYPSQQQQVQTQPTALLPHLQRRSLMLTPPLLGTTTLGAPVGAPIGSPMGVDGSAQGNIMASCPQAEKTPPPGEEASQQFAHAAVRLLWGALRGDEQHLQLDSPGRAPFLGGGCGGPWGGRGVGAHSKAVYEENGNAFELSDPQEWLPLPRCFSRLLCCCDAAADINNNSTSSSSNCCCTSVPPYGFIPELNRLWVADDEDVYFWEVGRDEEAVERLSLSADVESVVYVHLSRDVLPPALRASFCWDDGALSSVSVVTHLDPSGCTDTPPFADVSSSPLHCLAISTSTSVRLFAVSATAGAPRGGGGGHPQQQGPSSISGIEFIEIGAAEKPRGGAMGAPLELRHAGAHTGSGLVFFGASSSQQIYVLDVTPRGDDWGGRLGGPLGFPQLSAKRARGSGPPWGALPAASTASAEGEAASLRAVMVQPSGAGGKGLGFRVWGLGGRRDRKGENVHFVCCRLVPLNPKLSDWLVWGFYALSSSFGFRKRDLLHSGAQTNRKKHNREIINREGWMQIEIDEPRGILWALGGDSSLSAFVLPTPNIQQQTTNKHRDPARNIKRGNGPHGSVCLYVSYLLLLLLLSYMYIYVRLSVSASLSICFLSVSLYRRLSLSPSLRSAGLFARSLRRYRFLYVPSNLYQCHSLPLFLSLCLPIYLSLYLSIYLSLSLSHSRLSLSSLSCSLSLFLSLCESFCVHLLLLFIIIIIYY